MNADKRRNRRCFGQYIYYALYIASGACLGIAIQVFDVLPFERAGALGIGLKNMAAIVLFWYAASLIQTVIHEAGHMVFGLMTGYSLTSFRVMNLIWIRKGDRFVRRRMKVAGTGGQCLMNPPEMKNGELPVMLYNIGGPVASGLAGAVCLGLWAVLPEVPGVSLMLLLLAITGIVFSLVNGIPINTGMVANDGLNALMLSRDPLARRRFWAELRINAMQARGMRLRDMPAEWFDVPEDADLSNFRIAAGSALACSRLMDEGRYEAAEACMERLLADKDARLYGIYRGALACDLMYIRLMDGGCPERAAELYTREVKRFLKCMPEDPQVMRTGYVHALLAQGDCEKAEKIVARFEKCAAGFPNEGDVAAAREDMAAARARYAMLNEQDRQRNDGA